MPKPPTVVGTREIVRMLRISRSYAAQLVNSKGFPDPTVRIGRTRGWLKTDVEAWARATGRELHDEEEK
jgi:predicted DNA-binding transcriptional regulator AlpA